MLPSGKYYLRYELTGMELVSCSISYKDPDQSNETLVSTYDQVRILHRPIDPSGVGSDTRHRDVSLSDVVP